MYASSHLASKPSCNRSAKAVRIAAAVAVCAFGLGVTKDASAYVLKTAPSGANVHWTTSTVTFELTPSLAALPGASEALPRALAAWNGIEGAPSLTYTTTTDDIGPAVDGRNVVYYAQDGYPAAGASLAVSIMSYDASTGALVDADIVINGQYDFSLLPDDTQTDVNAPMVNTDGDSDGEPAWRAGAFDLIEVTSHEIGHCLGLAHDPSDTAAIMFPMVAPGGVSRRDPAPDDVAGVVADYAGVQLSDGTPARGCSVGAAPLRVHLSSFAGLSLALAAFAALRRRSLPRRA